MKVLLALYALLMVVEALGTGVFLVLYLRYSAWRDTPVGRHLAFYSASVLALLVLALMSMAVRSRWMAVPGIAAHVVFAAMVWQRVRLVWRAQHIPPNPLEAKMTRPQILPLPQGADARNRALRTFVQGLLLDVAGAAAMLLAVALADVRWTRIYWLALGASLLRTVAQTGAAYIMRHLKPPPTA